MLMSQKQCDLAVVWNVQQYHRCVTQVNLPQYSRGQHSVAWNDASLNAFPDPGLISHLYVQVLGYAIKIEHQRHQTKTTADQPQQIQAGPSAPIVL